MQKSWKRAAATTLFVVAVAAAGTAVPIVAHAGTTGPACTPHGSAAGRTVDDESIGAATATMKSGGKTEAEIVRTLENEWCLTLISSAQMQSMGGNSHGADVDDLQWTSEIFRSDADPTSYYTRVTYQWIDHDYASDMSFWNNCAGSRAIGGTDGVAVRLSGGEYQILHASGVFMGDWNLDQYDGDYGVSSVTNTSSPNQYGVGYVMQENTKGVRTGDGICHATEWPYVDLDRYYGQVVLSFRRLNGGCGNTQVFADYVHTWESTALTGIGAGKEDFSFSWDSKGHDFTASMFGATGVTC